MSCNLRKIMIDGVRRQAEGAIEAAKANVEIYLHNPAGIGEHPDVIGAIVDQLDVIAEQEERLVILDKHFSAHHD
jgi:hypothetical protein